MSGFTADHQVFTTKGWKRISEVSLRDTVACLTDKGTLKYRKPLEIHQYADYNKTICVIENDDISLSVTSNYPIYLKQDSDYQLIEAGNLNPNKDYSFRKDVNWEPESTFCNISGRIYKPPPKEGYGGSYHFGYYETDISKLTRDELMLFGIIMTIGETEYEDAEKEEIDDYYYTSVNHGCGCCSSDNIYRHYYTFDAVNGKWQQVKEILDRLGYNYDISDPEDIYYSGETYCTFKIFNRKIFEYFDEKNDRWIEHLSREQSQWMIAGIQLIDLSGRDHSNPELQSLLLQAGYALKNKRLIEDSERRESIVTINDITNKEYKGPIYNLKVPGEVFLIRSNDKTCWT